MLTTNQAKILFLITEAWKSTRKIQEKTNVSQSSIEFSINKLLGAELIERIRLTNVVGKPNVFRLTKKGKEVKELLWKINQALLKE
jgi:DNA-binding MarR family transcriptional regulator